MKTRIMFFLQTLTGGGAERVTINIMKLLDKKQFNVFLVLVKKTGVFDMDSIPKHVKIIDLGLSKTLFSPLKLRETINQHSPHIIYSTLFRTHIALDLALLGIKKRPKTILRSPNSPKLLFENKQLSFLMKYFVDRAYKKADKILAQTPEMKQELSRYHQVDENKIEVFVNPLDVQGIDEKTTNIKNPFDSKYINILASGRLTHQKGFDVLLHALRYIVSQNECFRLHILGEKILESEYEALTNLIKKLQIEKYVRFWGYQKNPYKFYKFCDVYVLSSRWEGLPNTVLEVLYLKKPVVATRCIPFMETLIANGKNGILVNVENPKELANAILDYKEIDTSYQTIDFEYTNIERLFKENL